MVNLEWELFWKLWLQKNLRNLASMKFQVLMLVYLFVVIGMLLNIIPAITGCSLIGGGFVTLALGRVYTKTKLTEDDNDGFYGNNGNRINNKLYENRSENRLYENNLYESGIDHEYD